MAVPSGVLTPSSGNWTDLVQTAFDTTTGTYLNDMPTFRAFTDKKPVSQAMPGDVVTLTITGKLPINKTPLTESLDVDAVQMPANRQLNVTLLEYGNAVVNTNFLEQTAFTKSVAQDISREIAVNMNDSIDEVYRDVLDTATNVLWNHASTGPTTTDPVANRSVMSANTVATAVAALRRRLAAPRDGQNHHVVIHPDVAYDLRKETGTNAWIQPHINVDTAGIYNAEVGTFLGGRFFEHTRCTFNGDGANPDFYHTYFLGLESLVEAVRQEPQVRIGPQIDKLNRFRTVGWYALLGVSIYRQNAIQLVKTTSTLTATGLPAPTSYDGKA